MKRFLFYIILVAVLFVGYLRVRETQWWGNGAKKSRPEKYTPAQGPKINLQDVQVLAALDEQRTKLVEAVVPSVVCITTTRVVQRVHPLEQFFGRRRGWRGDSQKVPGSLGSGVVISKEGHVLTNNHVIANMDEISVQLNDGRIEPARVIGVDEAADIAVLQVEAKGLAPLALGDSDAVKVGQYVLAVGSPFGLQETVTDGIISATGRRQMSDSANEFFQTSAPINPGNSGGPLVNLRGEIIGINAAIYSQSGGSEGVGFAIPSNTARRILEGVIKHGRVIRGYLGVVIQELTTELSEQFGAKGTKGALITDVAGGSPAEKAGLKPGDVVRHVNGREIKDPQELRNRIAQIDVGTTMEVAVLRGGEELKVKAQIEEPPSEVQLSRRGIPPRVAPPAEGDENGTSRNALAGVKIAEIPPAHRQNLAENVNGVMVAAVEPRSAAARVLQTGDVIEEINKRPTTSVKEFEAVVETLKPEEKQMLLVCRGRSRSFVVLDPR